MARGNEKTKQNTTGADDARLGEYLCAVRALADDAALEQWSRTAARFSIGAQRRIMREEQLWVKMHLAQCLYHERNQGRVALRALSLWHYWSLEEYSNLVVAVLKWHDREERLGDLRYILTRLTISHDRSVYIAPERSMIEAIEQVAPVILGNSKTPLEQKRVAA